MKTKITSLSKIILSISKIARALMIIAIAFVLASTIYVYYKSESSYEDTSHYILQLSEDNDEGRLTIQNQDKIPFNIKVVNDNILDVNAFSLASIIEISIMIIYILILTFIIKIFSNILKNNSPFILQVVKDIRYISFCIIGLSPVTAIIAFVGSIFLNVSSNISLQVSYIFIGIIFLCLSEIFSYGTMLQTEHDETI